MNTKTKNIFTDLAIIFVAALISALSLEVFLLPSGCIAGSSTGIAGILDMVLTDLNPSMWYFSAGIWMFVINLPICIYLFVSHSKEFATRTFFYVTCISVMLVLLRLLGLADTFNSFINKGEAPDKVVYVVVGGALRGICLPLVITRNASTGGSDVVGLIVQRNAKKGSSGAMRAILTVDIAVITMGAVAMWIWTKQGSDAFNMLVYSVTAVFICEIVQERIYRGFSSAVELEITTDKPQEMVAALQQKLNHGTTSIKVTGGFSGQEKIMVLCVINKHQLTLARKIINSVDSTAFAYVENVREVIGKGFANKEYDLQQNHTTKKTK